MSVCWNDDVVFADLHGLVLCRCQTVDFVYGLTLALTCDRVEENDVAYDSIVATQTY